MSALQLLAQRRFGPLFLSQMLAAFNDNLFKNALVVLALLTMAEHGPLLVGAAGTVFIAPYILLSATAGQLADRHDKARLFLRCKQLELLLMVGGAAGLWLGSMPLLMAVLCGLGLQSTFLSPLKYGLLPEQLGEGELMTGNGLIEAGTFLGILAGTITGGMLVGQGGLVVGLLGIIMALLGVLAASRIPGVPPADSTLRVGWNLPGETIALLRMARGHGPIWLCILAIGWFWTVGATVLSALPVVGQATLGGGAGMVTLLLAVFSLGIGLGSLLCNRLLAGEITPRLLPFAGLGISLFCGDFALAASAAGAAGGFASPDALLASATGWRMMLDLVLLAAAGGIYSVPLYAILQDRSPPVMRSRMVAANNVMNAAFMVLGGGAFMAMAAAGWSAPGILLATAAANLLATAVILRRIPHEAFRTLFRLYFALFHRATVRGLEHYQAAGSRVVIVANHLSLLDACLIASYLPDTPTFAINRRMAEKWYFRPFLAAVDLFKVDIANPQSVAAMVRAVRDDGRKLMIFPEGRRTSTGGLMDIQDGAAVVADKAGALVVPIIIDGLQYTPWSRMGGKAPRRWFPAVSMTVLPAVDLRHSAEGQVGKGRRRAMTTALRGLLTEGAFRAQDIDRGVFRALLDAAALYGRGTPIIEDVRREPMSYGRLLTGSVLLGRRFAAVTTPGEMVGVLLPNANAVVASVMGLMAFGRVPAVLNSRTGPASLQSACALACIKTVICSRAFVAGGKLEATIEALEGQVRFLWLEDIAAAVGRGEKLSAMLTARLQAHRLPGALVAAEQPAMVLFTSGSEGTPKGVVWSHRNILANCAQIASVFDFNSADRVMNAMPTFHSFGMTGGTLLPLLRGVPTFFYPSPLHYRVVPAVVYDTDATIVFGTDTFLTGWARHARPMTFHATRYIIAGAERVRDETRRVYAERFGKRILEGYGATETAPALCINSPAHNCPGTVGGFLPGIEHRLEAVPGLDGCGRLLVRGPNVMLGYLRASNPGVIEPLADGWYDTGDIISQDDEGFVRIRGRAKRFAKIAGEMVSLTAAEELVSQLWPGSTHAVVSVPDAKKGEALLLVTAEQGASIPALLAHARATGVPEIQVPRSLLTVQAVPLLPTGKTDYPAIAALVAAEALKLAA